MVAEQVPGGAAEDGPRLRDPSAAALFRGDEDLVNEAEAERIVPLFAERLIGRRDGRAGGHPRLRGEVDRIRVRRLAEPVELAPALGAAARGVGQLEGDREIDAQAAVERVGEHAARGRREIVPPAGDAGGGVRAARGIELRPGLRPGLERLAGRRQQQGVRGPCRAVVGHVLHGRLPACLVAGQERGRPGGQRPDVGRGGARQLDADAADGDAREAPPPVVGPGALLAGGGDLDREGVDEVGAGLDPLVRRPPRVAADTLGKIGHVGFHAAVGQGRTLGQGVAPEQRDARARGGGRGHLGLADDGVGLRGGDGAVERQRVHLVVALGRDEPAREETRVGRGGIPVPDLGAVGPARAPDARPPAALVADPRQSDVGVAARARLGRDEQVGPRGRALVVARQGLELGEGEPRGGDGVEAGLPAGRGRRRDAGLQGQETGHAQDHEHQQPHHREG